MKAARPEASADARITALESRVAALEALLVSPPPEGGDEDGVPRKWLTLREAAEVSGYSVSGLRKLMKQGRVKFRRAGPHPRINIFTVPRRDT